MSNFKLRKNARNDINETPDKASATPLEVRFARFQSQLNRRRQQLIQALLDNPEETYFLSSRALARRYHVDAATIVRTIQALGYERFADFAADFRRHFVMRITPYIVMKAAAQEKRSLADQIRHSVDRDSENLRLLRSGLDTHRVIELAKLIHRSRRIMVVGVDLAASLAWFLAYGLISLGFDAEAPVGSAGNLHHKVRVLTNKDLLIAISFGPCLRQTVESVLAAKRRGVPTFGITDSDTTPIARHCDRYVCASIANSSFTGSYAAPMALLSAIFVACAHLRPGRSLARLRQFEEEYRSGSRWYQEPPRRARSQRNGNQTAPRAQRKQSRRSSYGV